MVNVLLLSVGTRNKIVQYFKRALRDSEGNALGRVVCTDMSFRAPALYEADAYYQVPKILEDDYIKVILDICKKEEITGILSLIDPELSLLAEHKEEFDKLGIAIIGSSKEVCDRSLDKMRMYEWLIENGYYAAKSYNSMETFLDDRKKGNIDFPVFAKPVKGSASVAISKVDDEQVLRVLCESNPDLMVQELLDGREIGADVYIDMISGEVVSIFTKYKILMRAGETDKSISFKDQALFELIERFVKDAGYRGQIDIDIFDVNGKYYISEVNPRFGGGYPHAHECGLDHMKLIINNLQGKSNPVNIGDYKEGVYMLKYNEIMII